MAREHRFGETYFPPIRSEYIPGKGTLTLLSTLPASFKQQFVQAEPWKLPTLSRPGSARGVVKAEIGGICLWVKPSIETLNDIKDAPRIVSEDHDIVPRRDLAKTNLPLVQFAKYETVRKRYKQEYGREVVLEEPLAGFVAEGTGRITMYYRHYQPKTFTSNFDELFIRIEASARAEKLHKQLARIGVSFGDTMQCLIVDDPQDQAGVGIVIIDQEMMRVF